MNSEALPPAGSLEPPPTPSPEFFGHRLQTSMTCATVEDSTAGLGQTLRLDRPLIGGLSVHGVLGVHEFTGMQAARRHSNPECVRRVSCRLGSLALGVGELLVIHTPCDDQRSPDLKQSATKDNR